MGQLRRALPIVLLLGLMPGAGAEATAPAATVGVMQLNYVFTPERPLVRVGDTVRWTNEVGTPHTTTADGPLSLWDSLTMQHNETFDFTFTAAGSYAYRCILHDGYGMVGRISIGDQASPLSGPVGTPFTITVASVAAPTGFVYDIQKKDPGAGFRTWMTGVTTPQVTFDSTGQATGTYQFKSRYRRVSDGAATLLSLAATITVTA